MVAIPVDDDSDSGEEAAPRARAREAFRKGDFGEAAALYSRLLEGARPRGGAGGPARPDGAPGVASTGSGIAAELVGGGWDAEAASLLLDRALCALRLGEPSAALGDAAAAERACSSAAEAQEACGGEASREVQRCAAKACYVRARALLAGGGAGGAMRAVSASRQGLRRRRGDDALMRMLHEALAEVGTAELAAQFAALVEGAQGGSVGGGVSARDGRLIKVRQKPVAANL